MSNKGYHLSNRHTHVCPKCNQDCYCSVLPTTPPQISYLCVDCRIVQPLLTDSLMLVIQNEPLVKKTILKLGSREEISFWYKGII